MPNAFGLAALTALATATLPAQPPAPFPSDSAVRAILQQRVDSGRAVGLVVGLIENGGRREGDALWAQATGQPPFRLWAESPTRFFLREVDAQISFEAGETGPALALVLHQNGASQRALRRTP